MEEEPVAGTSRRTRRRLEGTGLTFLSATAHSDRQLLQPHSCCAQKRKSLLSKMIIWLHSPAHKQTHRAQGLSLTLRISGTTCYR